MVPLGNAARSALHVDMRRQVNESGWTAVEKDALASSLAEQVGIDYEAIIRTRLLHQLTAEEVRAEVRERVRIFGKGGGFVFNTVHNVQARTPTENVHAMYEEVRATAA